MSDIVEYFVRHYTLVLDNDQGPYHAVRAVVREHLRDQDISLSAYRAMSVEDRETAYAGEVGEKILTLIDEWLEGVIDDDNRDDIGMLLIREIMITSDSDVAWELGKHYLPETGDADNFLDDEEEDDDESPATLTYTDPPTFNGPAMWTPEDGWTDKNL
jgi:hypothetical protein